MAATRPHQLQIRPMLESDLEAVTEFSAKAFLLDLDAPPDPGTWRIRSRDGWRGRLLHSLRTDPGGSFVAAVDGRLLGVSQATRREDLWVLSMLAVDPHAQSSGAGRGLLKAALGYEAELSAGVAAPGLIVASNDPRALRAYTRAGFSALPCFSASGPVSRAPLADSPMELYPGDDLSCLDAVTRAVRGAPYGSYLDFLLSCDARLFQMPERGFVLFGARAVYGLVAADADAAERLLCQALAEVTTDEPVELRWLTADQQWAIRIALDAGLKLKPDGALMVRGRPGTLAPFIPTGPFG